MAENFRAIGYKTAARLLEYQEGFGVDLVGTRPYLVQCKSEKKWPNVIKAIKRIEEFITKKMPTENLPNIPESIFTEWKNQIPVVAVKVDHEGEYAVLRMKDFLRMAKR